MHRHLLSFVASLAIGCSGCATEPTRRPIEELYREALAQMRVRDDPAEVAARSATASGIVTRCPELPADLLGPAPDPGEPRVSDVFLETDVRQAIESLALQAGAQVLIDEVVRGTVTATVEDEPLGAVIRRLLLPLGYHVRRVGAAYFVGSADPNTALFAYLAESFEYRPQHVAASDLVAALGPQSAPLLRQIADRNLILVRGPREVARRILEELARLDRPVPQVVLEAIVCAYSPEDRFEFGLDVGGGYEVGGQDFVNGALRNLTGAATFGPAGVKGLETFDFASVYLRALEHEGYVSVRAAPRVMAQDGQRAVITIGEETYFTIGDGNNLVQRLEPVQTGIMLNIVPRIRGNRVTVEIERAEVSDQVRPSEIVSTSRDARLPTVNTRRVSTTVHVQDGQTIVIGGLVQRRVVDRVVKVPILGDLPLLGLLFQRLDRREVEVEVAIFLSPRIVRS